jgi:homocysteine S-methyltransferase
LVASGGNFTGEDVALVVVLLAGGVVAELVDDVEEDVVALVDGGSPPPEHAAKATPPRVSEAPRRHAAYGRLVTLAPLRTAPRPRPNASESTQTGPFRDFAVHRQRTLVTMASPTLPSGTAVVLDGGLSNALVARGHDVSGRLWTARLLREAPDEVAAVHRAYFAEGARVATTASYQASVEGFVATGTTRTEAEALIRSSVVLAREVRDEACDDERGGDGVERWVAASVGPYGAVLADGSEYRGRYGVGSKALRDFHRPRLELLASASPDFFAVETIPDVDEARVLVELLDEAGVPAWISFSCKGLLTGAGQPLSEAFEVAAAGRTVFAVGVNCCAPSDVLPALEVARNVTTLPTVAYPNGGRDWDARTHRWSGRAAFDPAEAPTWVEAGAAWVGGCCQVGPSDIAHLAAAVGTTA